MIGQERGSPASKPPPGASPAAAGLSATRGRFSRTRRKHSNGSVQSSSSSGTGQSVESIGTRQPSRIRIRRQQQRLSAVFGRGETNADTAAVTDDPSELSNHITAPGILKIFGTEICEGANYKSVLATTHSSARELVKEALARYSVSKADAGEYVLCDVIGCVVNHSWRTECVRALGENEKPLLLQSLWKPREGFARRFEIQRKATLEEQHSRDEDTLTAGINAQARKLQKTRSRGKSVCVRDDNMLNLFKSLSETDLNSCTHTCPNHTHTPEAENLNTCTHTCTNHTHIPETLCVDGEREETESSDDNCTQYCIHPPTHCPYLLLLQGYSHRQDLLLYALVSSCTLFGHHVNLSDTETEVNAVRLGDPDLLDRHCSIRRKDINTGPSLLKPLSGAAVQRNGAAVQDEVELRSGDFISIGEHYLLMFKDPTAPDAPLMTHTRPVLQQVCVECVCPRSFRNLQGEDLELVYDLQDEHTLLEEIFRLAEELHTHTRAHTHKLSVAFLLCVCVQHSVMHFFTADLRRLLLRVADRIQTSVWEKAKELAALQPENDRELLVALEPMLFWMSSSLQLLYFVQQEVPRLHKQKQDFTPAHSDVLELRLAIEETLSVLEEVFMFSFQQCVYYITKVLYTLLPAVLDSHAFSASGCVSMQRVLEVLMQTLQMLREHHLHPDVRSQLFSYLFYFSNTLLFNLLMERGSGGGFFCWSRGVQIRANLDLLLDWTEASGLSDLAQHFLLKLSSAVNLLATPRETLLQMSWSALRLEYPALNAAQLQHLLSQYEPQRRCKHTCCWTPPTDTESCAAHTTAELLECFDAPPPLVLPGDGFPLQLNRAVTDLSLIQSLQLLQKRIQNSAEPESAAVHTHTPTVMEAKRTKLKVHPKAHLEPSGHTQLQFPPDLDSCGDLLTQTLQNLELQDKDGSVPALDSSCLLTPPNTPRQTEDDAEQGECDEAAAGDDEDEDVFVLELQRAACGLGLLLVDGEETAGLGVSGIFIKSVLPDSPAALSERLKTGDRILAVNGKSLSGVDYQTGMDLIQTSGERPRLLVSRSHRIIRKTPENSLCDLGD
ncbi:ras-associating and dilute domain-containing protein [Danio aesculapii]|uniref:ras-associating and dilute domain-containing protein n=1 Tax=Danio aesculapii TaxID=1142201 RepID=UPI0024C06F93|nr:ras-associating and dilute domain-containing protein [Danio aesculapii]